MAWGREIWGSTVIALINPFKNRLLMSQNSAPEIVIELTKSYLTKLTDNELQEHFTKLSNKFAESLKASTLEDLSTLQSYLRLITAEMSLRLKQG
jgi:hypothetical protein